MEKLRRNIFNFWQQHIFVFYLTSYDSQAPLCAWGYGGKNGIYLLFSGAFFSAMLTSDKQKGGNCVEISSDFSLPLFNIQSILERFFFLPAFIQPVSFIEESRCSAVLFHLVLFSFFSGAKYAEHLLPLWHRMMNIHILMMKTYFCRSDTNTTGWRRKSLRFDVW